MSDGVGGRLIARRSSLIAFFFILLAAPALAAPVLLRPQYRIEATLAVGEPQIEGTVEVSFTNPTTRTLEEAVFLLFANRFSSEDADHLNDFTRPLVYPEQEWQRGGLQLLDLFDGDRPTHAESVPVAGLPSGVFVRVPMAPLRPGETRTLRLAFQTTVPRRFGSFGHFDDQLTALGGWYPQLVPLDASGDWAVDAPPGLADFDVTLTPDSALDLVLNGRFAPAGTPLVHAAVPSVHYLTLIAAPQLLRDETQVGATRIVWLHRPRDLSVRVTFGESLTEITLDTLREIVAARPAAVPAPAELVVVQAPLRVDLTAAGEGEVVVSDRLLEVQQVLRPFHELQLAQAVYAESLRPQLAPRESARDYYWVSEGVSRQLAERYLNTVEPQRRSVYDWIDLFNIFAAVDRFESTPKVPFTGAFFDNAKQADPLHAQVWSVNEDGPPGRVVVTKLRAELDPPRYDPLLDACLGAPLPLRECMAAGAPSLPVAARLEEWLGPYPAIDYRIDATDFNVPEGNTRRSAVAVRRVSSRPFAEPVTVRLRSIGGETVDMQWKSGGDVALMSATTEGHVYQAIIDPDRQLIDDDRANNAWLPRLQTVVDSADVEVSSTEFAFGAQLVTRLRYDYRKDFAVTGFYTNRGIGFAAGPRLHFGAPVDNSRFRHNLYGFYTFQALDRSFKNDAQPGVRTTGQLAGFGTRYDYSNVFWLDAPSQQRRLRLYFDWYDKAFGGDYSYLAWGTVASGTVPLWSPRTVLAGQLFNGFIESLGGRVPNQGLYSLGGERSIRGIGAEEQLARNLFVLRGELRQEIFPEVDLNLHDVLVLRRFNVHGLLDTGNVSNSAGRIYNPEHWAVGAGAGIGFLYDFFGFFPASAYLEVATRLDEDQGDVQVLFGSGQSF
ncbi:MAG: hypothetical protein SF182_29080 [Deltaproteobacteria bacterium]|nr:hypothetical protein [Deltaproteobacteria bacterium]